MKKKTIYPKIDPYVEITNDIIAMMGQDGIPAWRKGWKLVGGGPSSYATGRPYNGTNILLLSLKSIAKGYKSSFWVGMGEIKRQGDLALANGQPWERIPHVRKGEKGTRIVCPSVKKRIEDIDVETGEKSSHMIPLPPRLEHVWNQDQIENWTYRPEPKFEVNDHTPVQRAEECITNRQDPCGISFGDFDPAYYPGLDRITIPPIGQFDSQEEYYGAMFHEIAHSTGARKRLNRPGIANADGARMSSKYSLEELVAELSATILCVTLGVERGINPQHVDYLKGWHGFLKDNPKTFMQAAAAAYRATDYITNTVRVYETEAQTEMEPA